MRMCLPRCGRCRIDQGMSLLSRTGCHRGAWHAPAHRHLDCEMELLQTSIALSLIWVVQNVPPPVFEGLKAHLLPLLGHIGVVEVSRPCAIVAKTSCCRRHVNIMKMEKVCLQMKSSWIFRLWQVDSLKMSGEAEWGKQDQEKHLEVESIFRIGDGDLLLMFLDWGLCWWQSGVC